VCKPHYIVHVVLLSLADVNVHGYAKYPQQFEAFAHMAGNDFTMPWIERYDSIMELLVSAK